MGLNEGLMELAGKKFSKAGRMAFPSREAVEQATPELVAVYRANRIGSAARKKGTAVDLCCGIGVDAIALSKVFGKVYAIESDGKTIKCAERNALAYGAGNIEFVRSDYREIELKEIAPDAVFADPSRRTKEGRVRLLGETVPDTIEMMGFIRKAGAEDFCIEASNSLAPEELPGDCEKEFVSLEHRPNCISLYFGRLRKGNYSVVALPGGQRISAETMGGVDTAPGLLRYLFELDEGVVRMRLQKKLHESLGKHRERAFALNEGFFGAAQRFESGFFKNSFRVLARLAGREGLAEKLNKLKAGKVVLRGRFREEEQLRMKAELEAGLKGKRKLHVFFFEGLVLVCENLSFRRAGK